MRERFIKLAEEGALPFAQVCARFGISRKTGYKWLNRFRKEGVAGLLERDRVPRSHPQRTAPEIERRVGELLVEYPEWTNGRVRRELESEGVDPAPAITTIEAMRRRMAQGEGGVRAAPNDAWVLEMGPVTVSGGLNHRAYVLRDRATGFVLAADVLADRGEAGCREIVWSAFQRHGLPRRLFWPQLKSDPESGWARSFTPLMVEVMKLGVAVEFGAWAKENPDRQMWAGLNEKLKGLSAGSEVGALLRRRAAEPREVPLVRPPQETLVRWRGRLMAWADEENGPRLRGEEGRASRAAAYRPSPRQLGKSQCPAAPEGAVSRRVSEKGVFHFQGLRWLIGRAFGGERIELCRLGSAATVYFCGQPLGVLSGAEQEGADQSVRPLRPLESAEGVLPK